MEVLEYYIFTQTLKTKRKSKEFDLKFAFIIIDWGLQISEKLKGGVQVVYTCKEPDLICVILA